MRSLANLFSLIFLFFAISSTATAGTFPVYLHWLSQINDQPNHFLATAQLACNYGSSFYTGENSTTTYFETSFNSNFQVHLGDCKNPSGARVFSVESSPYCPANTTREANNCVDTCIAPQTYDSLTATCMTKCPASGLADSGTYSTNATPSNIGCINSCEAIFAGTPPTLNCSYGSMLGSCDYVKTGSYYFDGNDCNGNAPPPPLTPKVTLSADSCAECKCAEKHLGYGTVNGLVVCTPTGAEGSKNATYPTKTDVTQKTDSTGGNTSTSTATTVNNNGTVTTTTTVTNNNNGVATTATETKPLSKFCEDNPQTTICKHSTIATSCNGFQCDGDAIQCAIAQRAYKDRCEADDSHSLITAKKSFTKGEKLQDEVYDDDVQKFLDKTGDTSRDINVSSQLSESGQSNFTGQGIQDVTVTALGRTIILPFSKSNQYFVYFGYILLGLAYLTSYKFIASEV